MRVDKLLSQPAFKPSLEALLQVSSGAAHGATTHHRHLPLVVQSLILSDLALSSARESARPSRYLTSKQSRREPLLLTNSSNVPSPSGEPSGSGQGISDHEYQTRVGKACRVLVDSLPDFMNKGVVDLDDLDPDHESPSTSPSSGSRWSAKGLLPSLSPFLGQSLLRRSTWMGKQKPADHARVTGSQTFDSLYHPSIAFEFRPPLPHIGIGKSEGTEKQQDASPITDNSNTSVEMYNKHSRGGPTICFNGRTMYVASSHLLRHALSALFHDTCLHLESARFEGRSKAGSSWPGISPYIRRHVQSGKEVESTGPDKLVVRLRFEGISRVSSAPHTYTVIFKYEFDRNTGMIARHVVDNIQPVPGSKVWAGLTNVWGNLSPAGGAAAPGGGPTSCSPRCSAEAVSS